jgi:hypothetical protein
MPTIPISAEKIFWLKVIKLDKIKKEAFLEGFKKGIDSKSCCCQHCSKHSIALEEKLSKETVQDLFNDE